jgi:DNA mismatch repair protein MutL
MLERYGFNIEEFGDRTYLIRSVPSIIGNNDPLKAIVDMLDIIGKDHLLREKEETMVASISCHGSIRAGKRLTREEMSELARLLGYCSNPYHCPHGRPTIIHISPSQLEREFGRR